MSVTFSANIQIKDFPVKKVYAKDQYNFTQEECEFYFDNDPYMIKEEGTNLYYTEEPDIGFTYEINMANVNFSSVLQKIDNNIYLVSKSKDFCGSVAFENLSEFRSKLMKALNSSNNIGVRESSQEGNFYHCGLDNEAIKQRLSTMLEIVNNAHKKNVGVYWG